MKADLSQWRIQWLALVVAAAAMLGTPTRVYCATLEDTIPLPVGSADVYMLGIVDDQLLISCPSPTGGLHSYRTSDHAHNWSASLGTFTDILIPDVEFEVVPTSWALSNDRSRIYVGSGWPKQLVAVDMHTGATGPPVAIPPPRHILPQVVDNHDLVIVLTVEDIRVLDAANLNTVLYQDALPGSVNGPVYDESSDTLFVAVHEPDLIVKYTFDWPGQGLMVSNAEAASGEWPFDCELVPGNRVAVACTKDGTVRIHDRTTLALQANHPGLAILGDMKYLDGRIILVSRYSPEPGTDSDRGGVMSMDPQTGASVVEYFDDAYPVYAMRAPIPGVFCVIDAGIAESSYEPFNGGVIRELEWLNGHLWTFASATLSILDTEPLAGGHTTCDSGGSQNLVYLLSPDGTAINAYSIP